MKVSKYNAHVISMNNIPKHVHTGEYSEAWDLMIQMKESANNNESSIFSGKVDFSEQRKWWIESVTLSKTKI